MKGYDAKDGCMMGGSWMHAGMLKKGQKLNAEVRLGLMLGT